MILHFLSTFQLVGELFYMSIITDNDSKYIAFVKARHSEFLMSDLGPLRYFLEIEVSSTFNGFFISQEKYIQDFLALTDKRTIKTPMKLNFHFVSTSAPYQSEWASVAWLWVTMCVASIPHLVFPCWAAASPHTQAPPSASRSTSKRPFDLVQSYVWAHLPLPWKEVITSKLSL